MKTIRILLCEDTLEGIFTAIYEAYLSRYGHDYIKISEQESGNLELFSEYVKIPSEDEKAFKVMQSIKDKISVEAYEMIYRCAMSNVSGKADAIYRFLILGYQMGAKVVDYLTNDAVNQIFVCNRKVNNEVLHYLGFVRFVQLKNSILYARIHPANHILTLIAPHFSERLAGENWMIYDDTRQVAIIHRANFPWFITPAKELNFEQMKEFSDDEERMQALWTRFTHTISITERENKNLQRQNLPKRYRDFMPEFSVKLNNNV